MPHFELEPRYKKKNHKQSKETKDNMTTSGKITPELVKAVTDTTNVVRQELQGIDIPMSDLNQPQNLGGAPVAPMETSTYPSGDRKRKIISDYKSHLLKKGRSSTTVDPLIRSLQKCYTQTMEEFQELLLAINQYDDEVAAYSQDANSYKMLGEIQTLRQEVQQCASMVSSQHNLLSNVNQHIALLGQPKPTPEEDKKRISGYVKAFANILLFLGYPQLSTTLVQQIPSILAKKSTFGDVYLAVESLVKNRGLHKL